MIIIPHVDWSLGFHAIRCPYPIRASSSSCSFVQVTLTYPEIFPSQLYSLQRYQVIFQEGILDTMDKNKDGAAVSLSLRGCAN